ncbi:MAG: DegV family protein [Clostridiaceae bacterium]|nr:DegV family protein [Eubacteriales bacterium]
MIAIVTDSTIGIPKSEARALPIRIVPNSYGAGTEISYESYLDDNGDFERRIFSAHEGFKTSQATVSAFASAFSALIKGGAEVLCLTLSSRLSGAYSSACIAAREVDARKIAVVDSLTTAGGLYLLAKRARALIAQGLSLEQAAQTLKKLRESVGLVFSVDDMSALRRGGRLGLVPQSIGTVLNIRPILVCKHGAVVSHGFARGKADRIRKLVAHVPDGASEVLVHHMGEASEAEPLVKSIGQRFPGLRIARYRIGPVLAVHLGAGALGVAWISD